MMERALPPLRLHFLAQPGRKALPGKPKPWSPAVPGFAQRLPLPRAPSSLLLRRAVPLLHTLSSGSMKEAGCCQKGLLVFRTSPFHVKGAAQRRGIPMPDVPAVPGLNDLTIPFGVRGPSPGFRLLLVSDFELNCGMSE